MKKFISKGLIGGLLITMLLSTTAFADMKASGHEKEVDDIKVNLTFMSDDVKTGSNDLMVKLFDSENNPIGNAKVNVIADMDRTDNHMDMSNSDPLQINLEGNHEMGQYMGTIDFTDSGEWMIKVNYTIDGKESVAEFNVNVADGSPNWYIIGGFLGFIAIIIVFAAINKRRKTARI